jgi:YHS domain-containing protein
MNQDVEGEAKYHMTHNGRLYLFPSQKQLDMFKDNPERYSGADLAMNGYCSVCKVEMGKDVKGNPDLAVDYHGKRYLFPGQKQVDMFLANPTKYVNQ